MKKTGGRKSCWTVPLSTHFCVVKTVRRVVTNVAKSALFLVGFCSELSKSLCRIKMFVVKSLKSFWRFVKKMQQKTWPWAAPALQHWNIPYRYTVHLCSCTRSWPTSWFMTHIYTVPVFNFLKQFVLNPLEAAWPLKNIFNAEFLVHLFTIQICSVLQAKKACISAFRNKTQI